MYQLEKDMFELLSLIYKSTDLVDKIYPTELPLNYNYKKNKVGVYYTINDIGDNIYKNKISMDVNFYCLENNKIEMLKIVDLFNNDLNKKEFKNYWLTRKNIFLIPIKEDELHHYVLSYNINKY